MFGAIDTFQLVLAICTVLGGLSAAVYFHEKLGFPSWASIRRRLSRVPKAPVSPSSLGAYVHASYRSRALDKAIAEDFGLTLKPSDSDWQFLQEEIQALGLETIDQLDRLVAKHQSNAQLLARTFNPTESITFSHGLQLVLEIEAMKRFGADWYAKHLKNLQLTSTGPGYANDLWSYYQQVEAYGT